MLLRHKCISMKTKKPPRMYAAQGSSMANVGRQMAQAKCIRPPNSHLGLTKHELYHWIWVLRKCTPCPDIQCLGNCSYTKRFNETRSIEYCWFVPSDRRRQILSDGKQAGNAGVDSNSYTLQICMLKAREFCCAVNLHPRTEIFNGQGKLSAGRLTRCAPAMLSAKTLHRRAPPKTRHTPQCCLLKLATPCNTIC